VIGRRGRDWRAVHVSVVLGGALGPRLRGAGVSLATLDVVFDVPVVAFGGDLFGRESAQCRLCEQRRDRRLGGVEPAAGRGDVDFELGQQLGGLLRAGEVAVVGERLLEVGVGVSVDAPRVPTRVGCPVGFVNGRARRRGGCVRPGLGRLCRRCPTTSAGPRTTGPDPPAGRWWSVGRARLGATRRPTR
jgi:hypothetical protein